MQYAFCSRHCTWATIPRGHELRLRFLYLRASDVCERSGPQPFRNCGPVNDWQFCRGPGSTLWWLLCFNSWNKVAGLKHYRLDICMFVYPLWLTSFHWQNRPITCPERRRIRRLPRAVGQRRRQKGQEYNCVVQKVTKVHQEKVMNMVKVNEPHVQVVHNKIEVLYCFRFAARRVNIFSINLNFTYTRVMSQFGIHLFLQQTFVM